MTRHSRTYRAMYRPVVSSAAGRCGPKAQLDGGAVADYWGLLLLQVAPCPRGGFALCVVASPADVMVAKA